MEIKPNDIFIVGGHRMKVICIYPERGKLVYLKCICCKPALEMKLTKKLMENIGFRNIIDK